MYNVDKFAQDFYKLMNNVRKTMENIRNRMRVEIITKRDLALKRVCHVKELICYLQLRFLPFLSTFSGHLVLSSDRLNKFSFKFLGLEEGVLPLEVNFASKYCSDHSDFGSIHGWGKSIFLSRVDIA